MASSLPPAANPPSAKWLKLALVGALALMVIGAALFYYASEKARDAKLAQTGNEVAVTINATSCDPNDLTVPAGRTVFRIVNKSERAVEWEILDGVMVLEERENIAPGISQTLTAKLAAGTYEITCGLLSNPRGTLHVTPSANAESSRPAPVAFIGPVAEYRFFLAMQASGLTKAVQAFADAVKAGDLAKAQALYVPTRTIYSQIKPVADSFADLDNAIDAYADYFEKKEQDPGFSGFHRLEYGLFAQKSTSGLGPVAGKLVADAAALQTRLRSLDVAPEKLADGASRLMARSAAAAVTGNDERYSHTDLADFEAYVAGSRKIADLLRPISAKAAPQLSASIDQNLDTVTKTLETLKQAGGFPPYDQVSEADRKKLGDAMQGLAAGLGKLNAAIGLE
ncbi:MAG: iron uptake system protein EfeO [Parvibaculaceae bacterium]|nr:iron uptake system protein EfeO [Parvibaculaceae bacterium]